MLWQLNDLYFKKSGDKSFYAILLFLTLARVLSTTTRPCLPDFDCNAYIQMASNFRYDPQILGHHAMRVLPSFIAGGLHEFGLSLALSFQLLSGSLYILFGVLTFWVLRRCKIQPWIAFSFTLLCLATHHAMRIPLQNVYQACDMMTYPLSLLIIYCSFHRQVHALLLLTLISIVTKQNVFILGFLSLFYCLIQGRKVTSALYIIVVLSLYTMWQNYYHAGALLASHFDRLKDFLSVSHLIWVVNDSALWELFLPIFPLLIIYFKELVVFMLRYWHISLYLAIAIGQPLMAYHLTGNNFPRLALQGVWIIYLSLGIISLKKQWPNKSVILLVIYSLSIYFIWSVQQRVGLMLVFFIIYGMLLRSDKKHSNAMLLNKI